MDLCVQALAAVHESSGYPSIWPADPARWLTPSRSLRAWVAATSDIPVAGHVLLRQPPPGAAGEPAVEVSRLFVVPAARRQGVARALLEYPMRWATARDLDLMLDVEGHALAAMALYEGTGFRLSGTRQADWTAPDGQPVTLYQYAWRNGGAARHCDPQ
jgi:GNAT superfamily N-acetyltransferase